jgi:hypothetical protein
MPCFPKDFVQRSEYADDMTALLPWVHPETSFALALCPEILSAFQAGCVLPKYSHSLIPPRTASTMQGAYRPKDVLLRISM